jgi:tetratricopeptide (TPR) repeat protein
MRKHLLPVVMLAVMLCGSAVARVSFSESLANARDHLKSGDFDKAIEIFHELQVDHPDSAVVAYGIGKALYARAEHQEQLGAKDEASAAYKEAETAFARVPGAKDSKIALESGFARLNAAARSALLIPPDQKYDDAVKALRGAVAAYEQFLREHPAHEGAQKNLDHVRLELKKLLQNPQQQQNKQDDKKQPPDDKKQPMIYFQGASTDIPNARPVAKDNQLELVMPGKGEARP